MPLGPVLRSVLGSALSSTLGEGVGGTIPFTISSIFADGTDGFYFDFSQTDQLFQESIGPTPADGAGENIGLALESSKWAGRTLAQELAGQPELISPTAFDPGAVWTSTNNAALQNNGIVSGALEAEVIALYSGSLRVYREYTLDANSTYLVTGDVVASTVNAVTIGVSANTTGVTQLGVSIAAGSGSRSFFFNTGANNPIRVGLIVTGTDETIGDKATLTNLSLRKIPGRHGVQANLPARPSWQTGGLARFDGSDDNLLTPLVAGTANTLMVKLKFGSSVANRVAIGGTAAASERLFLGRSSAEKVAGGVGTDSLTVINGGGTITNLTGVAALVQDGSTVGLYWNNTLIYSGAQSGAVGSAPLRVGAAGATASFFSDDDIYYALAIKKALTATEIADITNLWGTS